MGQLWNLSGRTVLATLAGLAVLEAYSGPAWAARQPSRAVPVPAARAVPVPAAVVANSSGRVSVDFVEADLGDVVKALSIQSGVNVVLAAETKGKVTVRLKGTTLEEALRLITSRLDNIDFKRINGAYVIGSPDSLRALVKRSGVTQTVTPRSLSPSDAREVAQGASAYVDITVQSHTNQLVLRGLPEDVAAARAAIEAADTAWAAAPSTRVLSSPKLTPKALADLLLKSVPELKCSVRERGVIVTGTTTALALADEVVRTADLAGGFPQVTRIYPLKYLNAQTAVDLFNPKQQQGAAAARLPDPSQGVSTAQDTGGTQGPPSFKSSFPHLLVRAGAEALAPEAGLFSPMSLDSAKTFNSSTGSSSTGSSGSSSSGATGGATTGVGTTSPKVRTLILMGPEDEVAAATALLDQMDVAPPQVMI